MGGDRARRILGIDPGSLVVGFGCLEVAPRQRRRAASAPRLAVAAANVLGAVPAAGPMRVIDAGVLRLGRQRPVPDRLLALRQGLDGLLARLRVDVLAIEEAFYGKSVASALRIGEARGVVLAGARERGVEVAQFAPARIKRAVAGHGAASKQAVAAMVSRQLGLPAPPVPHDASDALAVAYCCVLERSAPLAASLVAESEPGESPQRGSRKLPPSTR